MTPAGQTPPAGESWPPPRLPLFISSSSFAPPPLRRARERWRQSRALLYILFTCVYVRVFKNQGAIFFRPQGLLET